VGEERPLSAQHAVEEHVQVLRARTADVVA
jgi:hypothetical protein